MKSYVQSGIAESAEYKVVQGIAESLLRHLNEEQAQSSLAVANLPGQSSALVQQTFAPYARELGFVDESKGLFDDYANRAVRPDYYLRLGDSGILLEVERGKTTINNMDFLDFWKCHLCVDANYLFLLVPQDLRQNGAMSPRREYNTVVKRMASFFAPRNYTNVRGMNIFGY